MHSGRLPRFKRITTVAAMQLTARDRHIIRLIHQHRFLRSSHIVALSGGSAQQLLRRLKLLYHHGYVERPRCQIDSYHKGGSRPLVYGLGNKGGTLLKQELGPSFRPLSWGEKNRAVGRIYLEHALLVSDVMVTLELACRANNIRLLTERELLPGNRKSFRWKVRLPGGKSIGVIPDRVFALEFTDQGGARQRIAYFLEADRGTMPVFRRSLSQTSFHRKLLAYEATWAQSIHTSKFGFHRLRVITVTQSAARVTSLIEACAKLERGRGLFLFADRSILNKPEDIMLPIWKTSTPGEMESLIN